MHEQTHPFAGKTVRIKSDALHPQVPDFGGSDYRVEDWWDRVGNKSWRDGFGNPACTIYCARVAKLGLPQDDEVLYGKIGPFGHLVYVSEVEFESLN